MAALDGVLFAHRTARHNSTGFSPFKLLYGREPKLPVDVLNDQSISNKADEEFDEAYVKHVSEVMIKLQMVAQDSAHAAIKQSQQRQSNSYNEKHKPKHNFQLEKRC